MLANPSWFRRLPIRLWWFGDGLHVVETHPAWAGLLGARVQAIGDLSPQAALERVAPLTPGPAQNILARSARSLVTFEILRHIGATARDDEVSITFVTLDGRSVKRSLGPAPDTNPGFDGHPWAPLLPEPAQLAERWPHVLDRLPTVPRAFQPPVDVSHEWVSPGVLYVRSNRIFSNSENARRGETDLDHKLIKLLDEQVAPNPPSYVIVDLRFNDGGNFFNTLLFSQGLAWLMRNGRISVLVGRDTLSAAIVTAATIKDRAGGNAILVGEGMGDLGHFWAEGGAINLPHSGLQLRYASGYQNWENGCEGSGDCTFWPAIAYGVSGISLAPDVHAKLSFADYLLGRDTVLEAALAQ